MSTIRWLHISDFHYGDPRRQQREQPWKDMSLPKVDLLFFAGDLRNINEPDFQPGVDMLQQVKSQLHLGKNDLFLVPGNHDVDQMDPVHSRAFQEFAIRRLGAVQNVPADVLDEDGRPLTDRFSRFAAAVAPVWGRPNSTPAQVSVQPWKDKLNVIGLNTALLSTLDSSQSQIVDSAALAALEPEDPSLPAIVLGHHSFYDLAPEQQEYLKGHFARLNVRAYLHGDLHQRVENPILLADGRLIPCIAAPTIAKKPGDGFAQRGAYLYEWDVGSPQGKVTVIPYRWEKGRLEREEPGPIDSFPMRDTSRGLWRRITDLGRSPEQAAPAGYRLSAGGRERPGLPQRWDREPVPDGGAVLAAPGGKILSAGGGRQTGLRRDGEDQYAAGPGGGHDQSGLGPRADRPPLFRAENAVPHPAEGAG